MVSCDDGVEFCEAEWEINPPPPLYPWVGTIDGIDFHWAYTSRSPVSTSPSAIGCCPAGSFVHQLKVYPVLFGLGINTWKVAPDLRSLLVFCCAEPSLRW